MHINSYMKQENIPCDNCPLVLSVNQESRLNYIYI